MYHSSAPTHAAFASRSAFQRERKEERKREKDRERESDRVEACLNPSPEVRSSTSAFSAGSVGLHS